MIDLHMHSDYSDGINTPESLIQIAQKKNLYAISITDHHTWAAHYSDYSGIKVITGTELTVRGKNGTYHLLCHGFSVQEMDKQLDKMFGSKQERRIKYIDAIRAKGINIPEEEENTLLALEYGFNKQLAQYILATQIEDRKKLYSAISPIYSDLYTLTLGEARTAVRNSGGSVGLAHPLLKLNGHNLRNLVYYLADEGIDTLEVWHPHNAQQGKIKELHGLAAECRLIPIGGSDVHDNAKYVGMCFTPSEPYQQLIDLIQCRGRALQQTREPLYQQWMTT